MNEENNHMKGANMDKEKLFALLEDGCSKAEAARRLGVSVHRVYNLAAASGRKFKRDCVKYPSANKGTTRGNLTREEILDLYDSGCPVKEIAKKAGCTRQNIWLIINSSGRKCTRVDLPPIDEEKLFALLEDGCSRSEAARRLGVSVHRVYDLVAASGRKFERDCRKYPNKNKGGTEIMRGRTLTKAEIFVLYDSGHTITEIAKKANCAGSNICRILKASGRKGVRENLPPIDEEKLFALLKDGCSRAEAAVRLGVSAQRVYYLLSGRKKGK
jgi:DNA-binding CsgD family transcriptional regulator